MITSQKSNSEVSEKCRNLTQYLIGYAKTHHSIPNLTEKLELDFVDKRFYGVKASKNLFRQIVQHCNWYIATIEFLVGLEGSTQDEIEELNKPIYCVRDWAYCHYQAA